MKKLVISAVMLAALVISSSVYAAIKVTNAGAGYTIRVRFDARPDYKTFLTEPGLGISRISVEDYTSPHSGVYHWDITVQIRCGGYHETSFRNPRGKTLNIDYRGICGGSPLFGHEPRYYTYYTEDTP